MAGFKLDRFSGLMPRVSPSLLPKENATIAKNCEFAYGELRNVKGNFNLSSFSNSPKSIYTDDGISFYTWTDDVNAVRSPLSNDTFNRLYYTTPTDFRVASRTGMQINGGQPGSSYRVGVPRPTLAPVLTVSTTSPLEGLTLTATFFYEYAGVKYQEQTVTLSQVTQYQKWSFTAPANNNVTATNVQASPYAIGIVATTNGATSTTTGSTTVNEETVTSTGTPKNAAPVVRLVAKDAVTNEVKFDIYTSNSSLYTPTDWMITLGNTSGSNYTLTLESTATEGDNETRAYVYAYVNTYNEEGPPSPPAIVTAGSSLDVDVYVSKDPQAADYAPLKEIRIYRTPTGSEIADYFYVGAIPILSSSANGFTFKDDVKASGLNEPLASDEYYPPDPALVGLMSLPNGILCAWKGNELHFSDAYKPWSWPPSYRKTFTHAIIGGIVSGAGALITTTAQPFLISGVSPDSMTETKIKASQAGVSKWAMADLGGVLLYASNDGIVAVDGTQAAMSYSEQFFTRDVWRNLYRNGFSTMRFMVWDGRLVIYSSAAAFTPFMIRLDEAKGAMTELPGLVANCDFVSPLSDQSYFVTGNQLYQFNGGSDLQAIWMGPEMVFRVPGNFGMAQALVEGNWTIEFWALQKVGGVDQIGLKYSKAVTTGTTDFRLPSGFLSDRWQIKITGTGRFRELRVGDTARELKAM